MRVFAEVWERLRCLLFRTREERELDEELRFHLEMATAKNIEAGMTRREARRQAHLRFGGVERFKEEVREARGIRVLDDLGRDLRYAVRTLRRTPGFAITAIVILGLGIGANTALFGAVKGLLLDTIPVADPEGLVRLRWAGARHLSSGLRVYGYAGETADGDRVQASFSYPIFQELSIANTTLAGLFAFAPTPGEVNVIVDGRAGLASGLLVSGGYFDLLGVRPQIGRAIGPDDDDVSASPVAVISHSFWARRFGLDPGVIGRVMTVGTLAVTVVGVLPPGYTGAQRPGEGASDIHLPLAWYQQLQPPQLTGQAFWWVQIMGRVKPGVTSEQVQGNLNGPFLAEARAGLAAYLDGLTPERRARRDRNRDRSLAPRLLVDSGSRGLYHAAPGSTRQLAILGGVVGLLLLLVVTNVASLLLSRATTRQREIAVRRSVGATRARVVQQLVTEGIVLAALGGVLGVLVASVSGQWLPFGTLPPVDWRVLAFVATLSLLTGFAFSLVPALRASGGETASTLQESVRHVARTNTLLGKILLVVQVAVSVVLLVGAGLFLKTLANLRGVDVGFNAGNVLLFRLDPGLNGYDSERQAAVYDGVAERVRSMPGVRAVAVSQVAFLTGSMSQGPVFVGSEDDDEHNAWENRVSPEFFETMEIPLVIGRVFDDRDRRGAPLVVVLNQTAARQYFGRDNPIGRRLGRTRQDSDRLEVIGVVGNVKYADVRAEAPPTVYWPYAQRPGRSGRSSRVFQVKTAGPPEAFISAVREAVHDVDPTLPLMNVSTQADAIEERFAQERLFAFAYSLFGGLAMLLASVGLFGLASYGVARRTQEIGIRMALGAQPGDVSRMVLRESLTLVGIGVGVGIAVALAAGRLIESLLFELAPTDGVTIAQAVVVMGAVATVAAYLPARRAARVDPLVALVCD